MYNLPALPLRNPYVLGTLPMGYYFPSLMFPYLLMTLTTPGFPEPTLPRTDSRVFSLIRLPLNAASG